MKTVELIKAVEKAKKFLQNYDDNEFIGKGLTDEEAEQMIAALLNDFSDPKGETNGELLVAVFDEAGLVSRNM